MREAVQCRLPDNQDMEVRSSLVQWVPCVVKNRVVMDSQIEEENIENLSNKQGMDYILHITKS